MRRSKPDNRLEHRLREIEAWERTDAGMAILAYHEKLRQQRKAGESQRRPRRKRGAA